MSKLKTPREKKAASYSRDRRNAYMENSKASRKNIPRSKARTHRAERRVIKQNLVSDAAPEAERRETAVADARLQRLQGFKKLRDIPLGEHVQRKRKIRKP